MGNLVIIAIAIVAAVAGFMSKRERHKEQAESMDRIEKLQDEAQRKMREELEKEGGVSARTSSEALEKYRQEFARGSAMQGSAGKQMKVMADFAAEMQRELVPYTALLDRIEKENPLDFSTVKNKTDFAGRREFAREMLRLNARLRALAESGPEHVRTGLQKEGLSQREIEEFVRGFTSTYSATLPAGRKARQAEEDIANGMLELCDLLEGEWGKWKYKDGEPLFDSDATVAKYNAIFKRVGDAAKMQADAQREVLEISSRQR
jgi:hypothetical protein